MVKSINRYDQDMFWEAELKDGTVFHEQDYNFKAVQKYKEELRYFRLKGLGSMFEHNVETGDFVIDNSSVSFVLNGEKIGKTKDVINFKERIDTPRGQTGVIGYYTGFKQKNKHFKYIEVLFWVDMEDGNLKLRTRFTPRGNISFENDSVPLNIIVDGEDNIVDLKFENYKEKHEFVHKI